MKSRLLTNRKELMEAFQNWCKKADDIRIVTAWATTDCLACPQLRAAQNAISTMIVGLDFYTTSPSFLHSFRSNLRIGKAPGSATFHPKLYLFKVSGKYCCIIGSSNFTAGGFGENTELNICIEGKDSDPLFREVSEFIDEQEELSYETSSPEIDDYREQFERLAASRAKLAKFRASERAKAKAKTMTSKQAEGEELPEQLNKGWQKFVQLILAQEKRPGLIIQGTPENEGYLETSEHCQALFAQYGRLSRMPIEDRRFVGGTKNDAGWYGSMIGNGLFKQRLNHDPGSLDAALDRVPLKGTLPRGRLDAFEAEYRWRGSGVGTASRLLAMKRPDLFMCITSKNRSKVAKAAGVSGSSLSSFDGYWDLLQRIWKYPWCRTPQPKDSLERRIWKSRVALLDSVFYAPGE